MYHPRSRVRMMDQKQLELDFGTSTSPRQPNVAQVVELSAFARLRHEQRLELERQKLLAAIVSSVVHIRGSDPEAEAL